MRVEIRKNNIGNTGNLSLLFSKCSCKIYSILLQRCLNLLTIIKGGRYEIRELVRAFKEYI